MKKQDELMIKFDTYQIVYRELPNEVTLSFSITNCPFTCPNCHSAHLREDVGQGADKLHKVIHKYKEHITAVCFLGHGGEKHIEGFEVLLRDIKNKHPELKLGLYSGFNHVIDAFVPYLNYYKMGPYVEERGALDNKNTNQIFYTITNNTLENTTYLFHK